jgi:hypothetical protein
MFDLENNKMKEKKTFSKNALKIQKNLILNTIISWVHMFPAECIKNMHKIDKIDDHSMRNIS